MARPGRRYGGLIGEPDNLEVGGYIRLSREDGDKLESCSITTQKTKLQQYIDSHPEFNLVDLYIDDGFTGTNFERPSFKRMISDINSGRIKCVLVKDLSRFGRDYIGVGEYLERAFPQKGIRFIAIDDGIDSAIRSYDMMMPVKNIFNEQYAQDISKKVQSAFKTKQHKGDFVGAFPSYGYKKDPSNHNHLIIDEYAASVVQRIFQMYIGGCGKQSIARALNKENILCPSVYKQMLGQKYHNSNKLGDTNYWTYSTINKILTREMYIGNMEQGNQIRPNLKTKPIHLPKEDHIIVENTHEPIIDKGTWNTVQRLLKRNTRQLDFDINLTIFAGFLRCGDCGRSMAKQTYKKKNGEITTRYRCGSYQRYGADVCTPHTINETVLTHIILGDLNSILEDVKNLKDIVDKNKSSKGNHSKIKLEAKKIQAAIEKLMRLKQGAYEDYKEGLISKDEFIRFKQSYDAEEELYKRSLDSLIESKTDDAEKTLETDWAQYLLSRGKIEKLDREILVELIDYITVYDDNKVQIKYKFEQHMPFVCT